MKLRNLKQEQVIVSLISAVIIFIATHAIESNPMRITLLIITLLFLIGYIISKYIYIKKAREFAHLKKDFQEEKSLHYIHAIKAYLQNCIPDKEGVELNDILEKLGFFIESCTTDKENTFQLKRRLRQKESGEWVIQTQRVSLDVLSKYVYIFSNKNLLYKELGKEKTNRDT